MDADTEQIAFTDARSRTATLIALKPTKPVASIAKNNTFERPLTSSDKTLKNA
jgi:hypothetical protein